MSTRRSNVRRTRANSEPDTAGRALLMIVTPILLGGAVALAVSGATPLGSWLHTMFGSSRQRAMREATRRFAPGPRAMSNLRRAIIGSAKRAVVSVFGP